MRDTVNIYLSTDPGKRAQSPLDVRLRGTSSYQCGRHGKCHVQRTTWTPSSLAIIDSASRTIIDAWLMRMYLFLPHCHLHSRAHARTRPIGDLEGRHPHLGAYYRKTWLSCSLGRSDGEAMPT